MTSKPSRPVNINLRLTREQHEGLVKLSVERDVAVQSLIRLGIGTVTGVPDSIRHNRRPQRRGDSP